MTEKPILTDLIRNDPRTPEGKYLVVRRDGTVVEWPSFVLGARDAAAIVALRAYARAGRELGYSPGFCDGIEREAEMWEEYRLQNGSGDPDRGIHRRDDPATVARMRQGRSA